MVSWGPYSSSAAPGMAEEAGEEVLGRDEAALRRAERAALVPRMSELRAGIRRPPGNKYPWLNHAYQIKVRVIPSAQELQIQAAVPSQDRSALARSPWSSVGLGGKDPRGQHTVPHATGCYLSFATAPCSCASFPPKPAFISVQAVTEVRMVSFAAAPQLLMAVTPPASSR